MTSPRGAVSVSERGETVRRIDPRSARPYRCRRCAGSEYALTHGGKHRYCVPCAAANRRAWCERNREKIRDRNREAPWNKTPAAKEYYRRHRLQKRYGLSLETFEQMAEAQGGVCAICKQVPAGRGFHVDHCHTTGAVRGLLCDACNVGLSRFRDNPQSLLNAVEYLRLATRSQQEDGQ